MELSLSANQLNQMYSHLPRVLFTENNKGELLSQITGQKWIVTVNPELDDLFGDLPPPLPISPPLTRAPPSSVRSSGASSPRPPEFSPTPIRISPAERRRSLSAPATDGHSTRPKIIRKEILRTDFSLRDIAEDDPYVHIDSLAKAKMAFSVHEAASRAQTTLPSKMLPKDDLSLLATYIDLANKTQNKYMWQAFGVLCKSLGKEVPMLGFPGRTINPFTKAMSLAGAEHETELEEDFLVQQAICVIRQCQFALSLNRAQSRIEKDCAPAPQIPLGLLFSALNQAFSWISHSNEEEQEKFKTELIPLCNRIAKLSGDAHAFSRELKHRQTSLEKEETGDGIRILIELGLHTFRDYTPEEGILPASLLPAPHVRIYGLNKTVPIVIREDQRETWWKVTKFLGDGLKTAPLYSLPLLAALSVCTHNSHEPKPDRGLNPILAQMFKRDPEMARRYKELICQSTYPRTTPPSDAMIEQQVKCVIKNGATALSVWSGTLLFALSETQHQLDLIGNEGKSTRNCVAQIHQTMEFLLILAPAFESFPFEIQQEFKALSLKTYQACDRIYMKNHDSRVVAAWQEFKAHCKFEEISEGFETTLHDHDETLNYFRWQYLRFQEKFLPLSILTQVLSVGVTTPTMTRKAGQATSTPKLARRSMPGSSPQGSPGSARKVDFFERYLRALSIEGCQQLLEDDALNQNFYKWLNVISIGKPASQFCEKLNPKDDAEAWRTFLIEKSQVVQGNKQTRKALLDGFSKLLHETQNWAKHLYTSTMEEREA